MIKSLLIRKILIFVLSMDIIRILLANLHGVMCVRNSTLTKVWSDWHYPAILGFILLYYYNGEHASIVTGHKLEHTLKWDLFILSTGVEIKDVGGSKNLYGFARINVFAILERIYFVFILSLNS